jgi:hypothetical protein
LSSAGLLISSGEGTTVEPHKQSNGSSHDLSPRMLARSDSFAGDAKFIDKLQKLHIDSKLKCQKALKFSEVEELAMTNGNDEDDDKLQDAKMTPTK